MNELLLKIDDIQTATTEAEDAVYESLIESYDKMIMLMEYADDDELGAFGIFQEAATDGSKTVRKTNIIAKLIRFIKQMCQRIVIRLSQFKLNRAAKAIVKRYNVDNNIPIIPVSKGYDELVKDLTSDTEQLSQILDAVNEYGVDDAAVKRLVIEITSFSEYEETGSHAKRDIDFFEITEDLKDYIDKLKTVNNTDPDVNPQSFELVTKDRFLHTITELQKNFDISIKFAKKINIIIDRISYDDVERVETAMKEKEKTLRRIDKFVSGFYKYIMLKIRFMTLALQLSSRVDPNKVSDNPDFDDDMDDTVYEKPVENTNTDAVENTSTTDDAAEQIAEDGLTTTVQNWIKEKDADKLRTIIITRLASDPQGKGVVQKITQRCGSWLYEPHEQNERHAHNYEKPINDMTRDDWNIIYGDLRNNFSLERFRLLCKLGAKLKLT